MANSRSSEKVRFGSETPRIFTPPLRKLTPKTSRGWECIAFAEQVLGIELFPWQKWFLIHALELLADGSFRFQIIVLLVARQNGKSLLLQVLSLWRMYVCHAPLIIGTAQNLTVAEEQWDSIVEIVEGIPELEDEVAHIDRANGKKTLKLSSGSRYKVAAATRKGGRGLTGDLILLDELREHQKWDAWSAATKTTMTREEAQIIGASNAGDATSIVLRHLRQLAHMALGDPDGINGDDMEPVELEALPDDFEDSEMDSIGLFEWSAPPGVSKWDRSGWQAANPSMGWKRTFERKLAGFAASDPEAEFRTECLCQWVDSMQEGAFPSGVWETQKEPHLTINTQPTVALDIRGGMRQSMSLVVAGGTAQGVDLVQVARYELGRGKQWAETHVVDYVEAELKARGLSCIVMDDHGENGPLVPLFEKRGIEVIPLSLNDMRNGCMGFHSAIINGRCKHLGEEPLNVAVVGAQARTSGEAWIWSRVSSLTDVSPLMAAAGAWWVHNSREPLDYEITQSVY